MVQVRRRLTAATATSMSVAAIVAGCSGGSSDDPTSPAAPSSTAPATTTARPGAGSSRYRDGEYEAKGWYGGLPSNIDVVVGRRIDEVRVSRLAGSSGAPDGFNDAIEKIKDEASR